MTTKEKNAGQESIIFEPYPTDKKKMARLQEIMARLGPEQSARYTISELLAMDRKKQP